MSARSLQYYVIARRWASELEFFKIETAFFRRLLDDYSFRLSDQAYFEEFKRTGRELFELEEESARAGMLLIKQLKHVELMAEDIIPENAEELAINQVHLEYLMTNITRDYREVKKSLFQLVENVLKDNKRITGLSVN